MQFKQSLFLIKIFFRSMGDSHEFWTVRKVVFTMPQLTDVTTDMRMECRHRYVNRFKSLVIMSLIDNVRSAYRAGRAADVLQ